MLNKNHWRSPMHLSVHRAASSMPSGNAAHASDFTVPPKVETQWLCNTLRMDCNTLAYSSKRK
ncbi:MAG: hypothetical protein HY513_00785 [Candidatus Aenigmarchaeota archaeon]|nr:hypothetical protein [Candidatus Aenigmarchaeota archaeon]